MAERKKKLVLSTVALCLIFLLAVVYSLYHIISLFTATEVKTIVSNVTSQSSITHGRGYIFRDEKVLKTKNNTGPIEYLVSDGAKVSKGQTLVNVYPRRSGDSNDRNLVVYLDRQIEILEKSLQTTTADGMDALREEANSLYYSLMRAVNSGESGGISNEINDMMVILNKMKALENNGDTSSIKKTLSELKDMRRNLLGDEEKAEIKASEASGYFYYTADGYEDQFTLDALEKLTGNDFAKLKESYNMGTESVTTKTYGKMSYTTEWKFVLPLSKADAEKLTKGNSYEMTFTENGMTKIQMTFETDITAKGNKEMLCVFSSNTLPADFNFTRTQDVELTLSTTSGIYVPRTAVATNNGIMGVYVLKGNVAYFRNIEVVYRGKEYYLVKENAAGKGKYYSLGNNEQVIENSKNIFDGRVFS